MTLAAYTSRLRKSNFFNKNGLFGRDRLELCVRAYLLAIRIALVEKSARHGTFFISDSNRSKENLQAEPYSSAGTRFYLRFRKADAFTEQAGIVNERVNGGVVRMIECV